MINETKEQISNADDDTRPGLELKLNALRQSVTIAKEMESLWLHVYQQPLDAKIGVSMAPEVRKYAGIASKGGEGETVSKVDFSRHMAAFLSVAVIFFPINVEAMRYFMEVGTQLILFAHYHSLPNIYYRCRDR